MGPNDVVIKVYFCDGSYKSLFVGENDTTNQVTTAILEKVTFPKTKGLQLYMFTRENSGEVNSQEVQENEFPGQMYKKLDQEKSSNFKMVLKRKKDNFKGWSEESTSSSNNNNNNNSFKPPSRPPPPNPNASRDRTASFSVESTPPPSLETPGAPRLQTGTLGRPQQMMGLPPIGGGGGGNSIMNELTLKRNGAPLLKQVPKKEQSQSIIIDWINKKLEEFEKVERIENLEGDLKNGCILSILLEGLTGLNVGKEFNRSPSTKIQMIENNNIILRFLKVVGVNLVNINGEDLWETRVETMMRFLGIVIKHFHDSNPGKTKARLSMLVSQKPTTGAPPTAQRKPPPPVRKPPPSSTDNNNDNTVNTPTPQPQVQLRKVSPPNTSGSKPAGYVAKPPPKIAAKVPVSGSSVVGSDATLPPPPPIAQSQPTPIPKKQPPLPQRGNQQQAQISTSPPPPSQPLTRKQPPPPQRNNDQQLPPPPLTTNDQPTPSQKKPLPPQRSNTVSKPPPSIVPPPLSQQPTESVKKPVAKPPVPNRSNTISEPTPPKEILIEKKPIAKPPIPTRSYSKSTADQTLPPPPPPMLSTSLDNELGGSRNTFGSPSKLPLPPPPSSTPPLLSINSDSHQAPTPPPLPITLPPPFTSSEDIVNETITTTEPEVIQPPKKSKPVLPPRTTPVVVVEEELVSQEEEEEQQQYYQEEEQQYQEEEQQYEENYQEEQYYQEEDQQQQHYQEEEQHHYVEETHSEDVVVKLDNDEEITFEELESILNNNNLNFDDLLKEHNETKEKEKSANNTPGTISPTLNSTSNDSFDMKSTNSVEDDLADLLDKLARGEF